MKRNISIMILTLVITLLPQLTLAGVAQGGLCTTHTQCNTGLACVDNNTAHAGRTPLTYHEMSTLFNAYRVGLPNWSETSLLNGTGFIGNTLALQSVTETIHATNWSTTQVTAISYSKCAKSNLATCETADWVPSTQAEIGSNAGHYKVLTLSGETPLREAIFYYKRGVKRGVEIKDIIGYLANKTHETGPSAYQYFNTHKAACAGKESATHKAQECQIMDVVISNVAAYLREYRAAFRAKYPGSSNVATANYVYSQNGIYVTNLHRGDRLVPKVEFCESMKINPVTKGCAPILKICSCASEGSVPVTTTQNCCQYFDDAGDVAEDDFLPSLNLPIVKDASNGNKCTASLFPGKAFGPPDGDDADTQFDYKMGIVNDQTPQTPADCEFVTHFNDMSELNARGLSTIHPGLDPVNKAGDRKKALLYLQQYMNLDWIILIAMEFLFIDHHKEDTLVPNFSGLSADGKNLNGTPFSELMASKIANPLKKGREAGIESFKVLQELAERTSNANLENCKDVFEDNSSSSECTEIQANAMAAGISYAIDADQQILNFENSVLWGNSSGTGLYGLEALMDCSDENVKRIESGSDSKICKDTQNDAPATWLEALEAGYHNIKFTKKYGKDVLKFDDGEWHAHKFKYKDDHWKVSKENRFFRVRLDPITPVGGATESGNHWLIEPPLPTTLEFGDFKGDKDSTKKGWYYNVSDSDYKTALLNAITRYYDGEDDFLFIGSNSELVKEMLKNYAYEITLLYSDNGSDSSLDDSHIDDDYGSAIKHRVLSRHDDFYDQVNRVVEELAYYFRSLAEARTLRIACLEHIKPRDQDTTNTIGGNSGNMAAPPANTSSDQEGSQGAGDKTPEADTKAVTPDLSTYMESLYANGSLTSASSSGGGSSFGEVKKQIGTYLSRYDKANQRAAARGKQRALQRKKALNRFSKKDQKKFLALESQPGTRAARVQSINSAIQGSSKSTSSSRSKQAVVASNAPAKKIPSPMVNIKIPSATDFGEDLFGGSKSGSHRGGSGSTGDAIDPKNQAMLDAIDKNKKKLQDEEGDSLFERVTKAYFRSGYKRLLSKKKKEE